MKPSSKVRAFGAFLASAVLALLLFAVGAAAVADWAPDGDGLPLDISTPVE